VCILLSKADLTSLHSADCLSAAQTVSRIHTMQCADTNRGTAHGIVLLRCLRWSSGATSDVTRGKCEHITDVEGDLQRSPRPATPSPAVTVTVLRLPSRRLHWPGHPVLLIFLIFVQSEVPEVFLPTESK
jgi:hypothetical protein